MSNLRASATAPRCAICGLPAELSGDGLCVACWDKGVDEANREQLAASKKAYREANREQRAAYQKAYYEAHKLDDKRRAEPGHPADVHQIHRGAVATMPNLRAKPRRKRGTLLEAELVASIRALHAQGVPPPEIAKGLGIAASTVYSHTSGKRRVPCPQCGTPMAVTSNLCRRCNYREQKPYSVPHGEQQQTRRPQGDTLGGNGLQNATAGSLATPKGYWQCDGSPRGAHYWELDGENRGVCKWCGTARQFVTQFRNTPIA